MITRIWNFLERFPFLASLILVAVQTWFCMGNRALWFSDEVRHGQAYESIIRYGKWLVLNLNGQVYPDKPPLYFWFLWVLDKITPYDMPAVFFLGTAISGVCFLWATIVFARALGFDPKTTAVTLLVMATNLFFVLLLHYSRMDLLFSAFTVLSMAYFYRYADDQGSKWAIWAFAMAGIAALIKGPFGFVFPLLGLGAFLVLKGEWKKLFTKKFIMGGLIMSSIICSWFALLFVTGNGDVLMDKMLGKHVFRRFTKAFHHKEAFYWYFITLPLAWLPWALLPLTTRNFPWLKASFWSEKWNMRKDLGPEAYCWLIFGFSFVFLSSLSAKVLIYILPLFPVLAALTARALLRLEEAAQTKIWIVVGAFYAVLGVGVLLAGDFMGMQVPIRGLGLSALILGGLGTALILRRKDGLTANLLVLMFGLIIWVYPFASMTAPSLDRDMSPKYTGQLMGKYITDGYEPYAYNIYSGIFTLYAGNTVNEIYDFDTLLAKLKAAPKAVFVVRKKHWDDWGQKPEGLTLINEHTIAGEPYLLFIKKPQ